MIKPKRLQVGDTIALIRPGSRLSQEAYENSREILRKLGFCIAEYRGRKTKDSFFAASDSERAAEIHWAMSEPGIRGVFSCRGGYGSQRALALISKAQWAKWKPKLILGYSDITYLHQWVQNQLGLVSIHGPLVGSLHERAMRILVKDIIGLPSRPANEIWSEISNIGKSTKAKGKLVGGNLSLIQVLGPAALPKEPIILAFEDVNENFYRIDRMLNALIDAGYSKFIRGIIVGTLHGCGKDDRKNFGLHRLHETLKKLTKGPLWINARFGHGLNRSKGQRLLPLGCKIELSGKNFRVLEAVVH